MGNSGIGNEGVAEVAYRCPRCWWRRTVQHPSMDEASRARVYCDPCVTVEMEPVWGDDEIL